MTTWREVRAKRPPTPDPYENKYAFVREDLSMYERVDPEGFPSFDEVDSTTIDPDEWQDPADAD